MSIADRDSLKQLEKEKNVDSVNGCKNIVSIINAHENVELEIATKSSLLMR